MCGIYGVLDLSERHAPPEDLLKRMGTILRHRGPDEQGQHLDGSCAIGMRRLSIIDVSGGHQPIPNEDGTIWVVCNGEIYNFQELRDGLLARGHRFRTRSDTEVLVHLYEDDGPRFLSRLRGMFALAIWDSREARLLLARDRLGKKPLYVRREPGRVLFASEAKALLEDRDVPRRLDARALREYLFLGYVPAPFTLLEGIQKLRPGHCMLVDGGDVSIHQYWEPRFDVTDIRSEDEWVEHVRETVLESVRLRMISDVPLGAFLSGGIDSSIVVAAMAQLSSQPVRTFSIGFEGPDAFYNELDYARLVARAFGTDHHELIVRPNVSELLPKLIWHMDEPIADSALLTTYLVSQLAARSVTVVLSGVGGDELFGGYRRYLGDSVARYYNLLPGSLRRTVVPALLDRLPKDRASRWQNYVRYAHRFARTASLPPIERYVEYLTVFSADLQAQMLREPAADDPTSLLAASPTLAAYRETCRSWHRLNQLFYLDLQTSFPDDLLTLTDKMTMAASIECRAPFVDHQLVELTCRMPPQLKIRGLSMKYLLKRVAAAWLPERILHRPKRGFGAPVGSWIRHELASLINDTLSEPSVAKRGLFNPAAIRQLLAEHYARHADHTDALLTLITLELWCRIFLDERGGQPAAPSPHAA
jgi:asparagine synthase (glutamine-hydrolysing)